MQRSIKLGIIFSVGPWYGGVSNGAKKELRALTSLHNSGSDDETRDVGRSAEGDGTNHLVLMCMKCEKMMYYVDSCIRD